MAQQQHRKEQDASLKLMEDKGEAVKTAKAAAPVSDKCRLIHTCDDNQVSGLEWGGKRKAFITKF